RKCRGRPPAARRSNGGRCFHGLLRRYETRAPSPVVEARAGNESGMAGDWERGGGTRAAFPGGESGREARPRCVARGTAAAVDVQKERRLLVVTGGASTGNVAPERLAVCERRDRSKGRAVHHPQLRLREIAGGRGGACACYSRSGRSGVAVHHDAHLLPLLLSVD